MEKQLFITSIPNQPIMKGKNESPSFYALIDRLKICSEIKHPSRPWSTEFYYNCAFAWIGKEKELLTRIEKLETNQ